MLYQHFFANVSFEAVHFTLDKLIFVNFKICFDYAFRNNISRNRTIKMFLNLKIVSVDFVLFEFRKIEAFVFKNDLSIIIYPFKKIFTDTYLGKYDKYNVLL